MKIILKFEIDADGYPVQLHYPEQEKLMNDAQRLTTETLRSRYHAVQRDIIRRHRELEARAAEKLLTDEPKVRSITRKMAAG